MRAKIVLAAVLAVALTTAVVAMAASDKPPNPNAAQVAAPGDDVRQLGVFRRGKKAGDDLPGFARGLVTRQGFGLNPGLARKAARTPRGQEFYLVPGEGTVALVDAGGSGGVDSVEHVLTGDSMGVEVCGRGLGDDLIRLSGVLPDGPGSVTVRFADGTSTTAPVVDNVWTLETAKRPASALPVELRWTDSSGQPRTNAIPVPSDVGEGACRDHP